MTSRVTVLGCGHSGGTPLIGNDWRACDPTEKRNRRTRSSIYVRGEEGAFIIDTGPDFREQINTNNINRLDAVIYSHHHADHTGGIDDLRHWCRYRKLTDFPVYMTGETWADTGKRYAHILDQAPNDFYPILIKTHILNQNDMYTSFRLGGIPVTIFEQDHKTCTSLGVRVGDFAYSIDMLDLSARSQEVLKGVKTWLVDCASYKEETPYVHANFGTIRRLNDVIRAPNVFLTHMPPNMDYKKLCDELPPGYAPAYDGMTIEVTL